MTRLRQLRSGASVATALLLTLAFQTPLFAKPIPRGTLTAADSMMQQAKKDAEKGKGDKAVQQAEKAIDMVSKAGGPDAPELIPLRASEATVAHIAGDAATEKSAALDGARIALAGPPKSPGVESIESTLEAMVQEAQTPGDADAHETARTYIALLEHEGVTGARLGEAYKAFAMTATDPHEEALAFEKRVKAIEAEKGAASPEALSARLDSASILAGQARDGAASDPAGAVLRLGAAEGLLGPLDPATLAASSQLSFVPTVEALVGAYTTVHAAKSELSKEDGDHAIDWLERGVKSLKPLGPETNGEYANLYGEEAFLYAASNRVKEAHDQYLKAFEAVDPKHGAISLRPTFLEDLLAFIDTPVPGARGPAKCRSADAPPPKASKLSPRCAEMDMVKELALGGAQVAFAAKTGLEKRFQRPIGVAACAANHGADATQALDVTERSVEAESGGPPKPADPAEEYDHARILVMCDIATAEKLLTDAISNDTTPRAVEEFGAFADAVWTRTGEVHRVRRVGDVLLAQAEKIEPAVKTVVVAKLAVGERLARMRDGEHAKPLLEAVLVEPDKAGDAPTPAKPDAARVSQLFRAHLGLARVAILAGDLANGAAELDLALDQADAGGASADEALKLLVAEARIDRDKHDAAGLAKVSTRALAVTSAPGERARKLAEIGRILEEGDPGTARSYYEALLNRSSTDPGVLVETARLYSLQGDHQTARSMLENAYSQDPKNAELDCVLMGELSATGEPGAAGMLRDKLVRELDASSESAPRALGCLIDGLAHAGHIADADGVVQRAFDAETKRASATGALPIVVPLEAAWAYRAAGDAERTAKWGALYQHAVDGAALGTSTTDADRDVAKAFVRDRSMPSLVELQTGLKVTSKTAVQSALETALRWQGRDSVSALHVDEPKDLVATVRDKLPADGALLVIVRSAPIAIDPSKTAAEAFDAIGPAVDVKREDARYVAYLLPKRGDPRGFEIGKARDIDDQVGKYIAAISSPRSDPTDLSRKLYGEIIKPVDDAVSTVRELLIVPDGDSALLPMGALLASNREPLLFRHAVSYLPSARVLLGGSGASPGPANEVFAAPDLAKGDGKSPATPAEAALKIPDAPSLRSEGEAWTKATGGKTSRYGDAGNEAQLKRVSAPWTVFFAAHGYTIARDEKLAAAFARLKELDDGAQSSDAVLTAGILLAGAKAGGTAGDDGFATALETTKLDLRGTKLVVLTPFDVGLNAPNAAEGLTAVRNAFFAAGAETVVTSLWAGDPTVTATLLVQFQKNLARGLGRAEALRLAQATIAADVRTHHPYYWAGFAAYGVTAPVTTGKQTSAQHDIDALKVRWGGCGCEVGASAPAEAPWVLAFACAGAAALRRCRARRRSL